MFAAADPSAPFASISGSLAPSTSNILVSGLPGLSIPLSALLMPVLKFTAFLIVLLMNVPGLSAPPFALPVLMFKVFTPWSALFMLVPELYASPSIIAVLVCLPRSSAPAFASVLLVLIPGLSVLLSPSGPELYSPLFPIWFLLQIFMLIPEKQRVDQCGIIIQRTSLEEAVPTFISLFSKRLPSHFFPSSGINKKRLFDKAFNLNSRLLADDHAGHNDKQSFAY